MILISIHQLIDLQSNRFEKKDNQACYENSRALGRTAVYSRIIDE
jgi:hypothetical protein